MSHKRLSLSWLGPLAVLGIGLATGLVFLWTAPQTEPEDRDRASRIVQTIAISPTNEPITVTAYGAVIPAREVVMKPEVRGRIIRHHPSLVPGGYIEQGAELIQIDPSDYELALNEQIAALEEAQFALAVEKGRQVIASREWRLLEKDLNDSEVNRALVLREPHLRRTEAMIQKATNEIAKAQLNLSRTFVSCPFNAMVLEESVEIGQLVESGNTICTLVGTDEFWVQATLPMDKLKWVRLPRPGQPGSSAQVILDTGNGLAMSWQGSVLQLLSDLESTGRMARLLVRVPDPMGLETENKKLPLLLGSYARVEIDAGTLDNVLTIPRPALREGTRIWIVNGQKELEIRTVEILWTRPDTLLIANCMQPEELLVVSALKAALPGMKVNPHQLSEL